MIFLKDKRLFVLGSSLAVVLVLIAIFAHTDLQKSAIEVVAPNNTGSIHSDIEDNGVGSGAVLSENTSYLVDRIAGSSILVLKTGGGGTSLRLLGVLDPEGAGFGSCYNTAAENAIMALLKDRYITVSFDQGRELKDSLGNVTAYAALDDGTDIGEKVLRMGYGVESGDSGSFARVDVYKQAESSARINGAGIWKGKCKSGVETLPEPKQSSGWYFPIIGGGSQSTTSVKSTGTSGGTSAGGTTGTQTSGGSDSLDALPPPPPPPPPPSS